MKRILWYLVGALCVLGATWWAWDLRRPDLTAKPMHTDEAVQAVKFGELLDHGTYVYDPVEYHGPTLYYFTLPVAWWQGIDRFADTTEATHRMVPLVFGVALVALLVVVLDGPGTAATVAAALMTAASTAMVFYSRYYIQEMLLVFFTFAVIAFGWRYAKSRRLVWALLAGVALGLLHATKETDILAAAAMLFALGITLTWRWAVVRLQARPYHPDRDDGAATVPLPPKHPVRTWHILAAVGVAVVVSVVFFSSFFTHWQGPLDSIRTYANYFDKGRTNQVHAHPWHYYLNVLLMWWDEPMRNCPKWSEALIVCLAIVGLVAALAGKRLGTGNVWFVRFVAVYALAMVGGYSAIGYKTPWCLLGFLHGMILLAGVGVGLLARLAWRPAGTAGPHARCRIRPMDRVGGVLMVAGIWALFGLGIWNLSWQARRAIGPLFQCDVRNPYVYGHTLKDTVRLCKRVDEIAQIEVHTRNRVASLAGEIALRSEGQPASCQAVGLGPTIAMLSELPAELRGFYVQGYDMQVRVIAPNVFPLPWYLRKFPNVGYFRQVPAPEYLVAPVIILGQPDEMREPDEDDPETTYGIEDTLRKTYNREYYGLRVRPSVFLQLYIEDGLWERFILTRSHIRKPPPPRDGSS